MGAGLAASSDGTTSEYRNWGRAKEQEEDSKPSAAVGEAPKDTAKLREERAQKQGRSTGEQLEPKKKKTDSRDAKEVPGQLVLETEKFRKVGIEIGDLVFIHGRLRRDTRRWAVVIDCDG